MLFSIVSVVVVVIKFLVYVQPMNSRESIYFSRATRVVNHQALGKDGSHEDHDPSGCTVLTIVECRQSLSTIIASCPF